MAIGLSTSGTLFGIRAAEQCIISFFGSHPVGTGDKRQHKPLGISEAVTPPPVLIDAAVTLLRATANGTYRLPSHVVRILGVNIGDFRLIDVSGVTSSDTWGGRVKAERTLLQGSSAGRNAFGNAALEPLAAVATGGYRLPSHVAASLANVEKFSSWSWGEQWW